MKRTLSLLLTLVMIIGIFSSVPVTVNAADVNNLTFELKEDGESYSVIRCDEYAEGELVIPDTYNGLSVTSIGYEAFKYCTNLITITIPDSVMSIGGSAFYYCKSLTSITIPDSVTSIGDYAFKYCNSLTSITIPDSVTSIGNYAFNGCTSLTAINVSSDNQYYTSVDGVLFNKDQTKLIQYPYGKTATVYTIPDSVTSIGGSAFRDCTSLTSVTIPDSVTNIGGSAFSYCSSLTSITIPDSVTSIGGSAFYYCKSLTSVTIPDSVTSIGGSAFGYCYSLTSITVDSANAEYSSVDGVCFNKNKTKLIQYPAGKTNTSYTIPDSVTSIGNYAFYTCDNLTSITIPDSVTSIGDYAFWDCTSLTSITIPDSVTSIGDYAFYSCDSLISITITDSVTGIGDYAFGYCYSLTSVTIGDSVISIGDYAFGYCHNLTSITIPDSVTHIGEEAFGYIWSAGGGEYVTIDGFTIYGGSGTAAERYAKENGFVFITTDVKPATPNLTRVTASAKGTVVEWGKVTDADSYNVYRKTYNASTKQWSSWSRLKSGVTSTSYTDTTAKSGVYYRYTIIANNKAGSSGYNAYGLKIKFLATPKLTSIANNTGKVTVKWNKVSGATGYIVYRRTYNASTKTWGGWSRLATTKSNAYNDTKAKSGVYYRYTVRAYYGDYTSYFHTTGLQTKFLATPTLKTVASTKAGVKVTWGKVAGSSGYYIYRKTYSSGEWTGWKRVGKVSGGSKVSYLDESTKPGVYYKYTVRAYSGNYASWYNGTGIKIKAKY